MQPHGSKGLGWEKSTVRLQGAPYLTRWFLRICGWTIRLHRFHRGDDDRAPHDHPWDFWTFPLCCGYYELIGDEAKPRWVRGWRLHFRMAEFKHRVLDRPPFYTIVVTKPQRREWGFWPNVSFDEALADLKPGAIMWADAFMWRKFVPAKEWR